MSEQTEQAMRRALDGTVPYVDSDGAFHTRNVPHGYLPTHVSRSIWEQWSDEDDANLKMMADAKWGHERMARAFNRSTQAVSKRLSILRLRRNEAKRRRHG
jgi:hypothetical protein